MKYRPIVEKNKSKPNNLENLDEAQIRQYELVDNYIIYNQLVNSISDYVSPKSISEIPTKQDYEMGYYIRYFAVKTNEPIAIEIDQEQYDSISQKDVGIDPNMYDGYRLKWKITGPDNDIVRNGRVIKTSISNSNAKTVSMYPEPIQKLLTRDLTKNSITNE